MPKRVKEIVTEDVTPVPALGTFGPTLEVGEVPALGTFGSAPDVGEVVNDKVEHWSPEPPPQEDAPPPPKKKRVMSQAQLANLTKAREAKAARKAALKEPENVVLETPQPPSLTEVPPPAPAKAKVPAVDFVEKKIEKAKAITKKVASTPVRKAPKQVSVDEKALKENQRRKKEAEERSKIEFDTKVAAAVKREMAKEKLAEKYMDAAPEQENRTPVPSRSQRQYEHQTEDGPVYVQQSRHGDAFIDRLFAHAPAHLRR